MNIQDTTMMYPNDKLLQPLADAKHSDKLKDIAKTKGIEQYDCFSFAVISDSLHSSNIGKPVMLFSCEETVNYNGECLDCVSVVSERGLTSFNLDTGEQGVYFGALVPKKWLRVLSFDEIENIIGIRPLDITYEEKPYDNSLTNVIDEV